MKKLLGNRSFLQVILGTILVLSVYYTFGLSTISYKGDIYIYAHIAMCAISCLLYWHFDETLQKNEHVYIQMFSINIILTLVSILLLLSGIISTFLTKFEFTLVSKFIFGIFFLFLLFKRKKYAHSIHFSKEYRSILIPIMVALILMYSSTFVAFKWDGLLYYEAFETSNLFSISSMGFYGHISQGAGIPIAILQSITFGHTELSIYILNALTILIGGISFAGIIRRLVPVNSVLLAVLTAIYLWSPWVLGMSGYASIDYYCANWFLVVLYFAVSKQYLLQSFFGLFFVMTKEPAIIIYGSLCFGILFMDYIHNKKEVFLRPRYYGMLLAAIVWLLTLAYMGIWAMPGSEAKIDSSHFVQQIGILYVFNFSWLIWLFIIIGFIIVKLWVKKYCSILTEERLVPIYFVLVTFSIFSFLFITVPNPRYTDIIPICGYVLLALIISIMSTKFGNKFGNIIGLILAVLMLVSSFFSVDPVSNQLYQETNIKDTVIYSTENKNHYLGDAMVYNKQAMHMEGALGRAIEDAIVDNRTIILSGQGKDAYYFDGMQGMLTSSEDEYIFETVLFNEKLKSRVMKPDDNTIEIQMCYLSDSKVFEELLIDGRHLAYIYMSGIGEKLADDIKNLGYSYVEKEYTYMGWTVYGLLF